MLPPERVGITLLVVLSLTSVSLALHCYTCKYDTKLKLDETTEDGFFNTKSCNTGSDWNSKTVKNVECDPQDHFCRVYTYTLGSQTIVERTCVEYCVSNTKGVTEKHGSTTSLKKTYCCNTGHYCNGVLADMKVVHPNITIPSGANVGNIDLWRFGLLSAAAALLSVIIWQ